MILYLSDNILDWITTIQKHINFEFENKSRTVGLGQYLVHLFGNIDCSKRHNGKSKVFEMYFAVAVRNLKFFI
jgi:hypothetical protein